MTNDILYFIRYLKRIINNIIGIFICKYFPSKGICTPIRVLLYLLNYTLISINEAFYIILITYINIHYLAHSLYS